VDEQHAPNYYELITTPMDLGQMLERAESGSYSDLATVEQDLVQMVRNCEQYNGPTSPYTQYAHGLWKCFARNVRLQLTNEQLSVDEQKTFLYAPPPPIVRNRKRRARLAQQKNRMLALQTLFDATEESIRDTFAQSPATTGSPMTHCDRVHEAHELQRIIQQAQPENLIFKRLDEWHAQIQASGRRVTLPEEAVEVIESPVSSAWLSNYPEEQQHLKYSTLLFGRLTQYGSRPAARHPHDSVDEREEAKTNNEAEESDNEEDQGHEPARLVIKLSRQNNDWKPVDCKRKLQPIDCCDQDRLGLMDNDDEIEMEDEDQHLDEEPEQRDTERLTKKSDQTRCQLPRKRSCRAESSINSGSLFAPETSFSNEHLISLYQ
jgi:hypothetical protein